MKHRNHAMTSLCRRLRIPLPFTLPQAAPFFPIRLLLPAALLLLVGCSSAQQDETDVPTSGVGTVEVTADKGPVRLQVRVRPAKPRLSDVVDMEIQVTAPPDVEIRPPAFAEAVGDFMVLDYTELPAEPGSAETRRYQYRLEPVFAGPHLIRSVAIEFIDRRPASESADEVLLVESDPIEIEVRSELGDQVPDLAQLEPMLPPRPLSEPTFSPWFLLVLIPIIAVLVFLLRRRNRSRQEQLVPGKTPEQIAQDALAALLAEDLPTRGLFGEFYLRLTGIVRIYIEATTGLRAPEQTTEEFLREVRSREIFRTQQSLRLQEFLEAADMVKYAGQQPTQQQIQSSIARAREFVTRTTDKPNHHPPRAAVETPTASAAGGPE